MAENATITDESNQNLTPETPTNPGGKPWPSSRGGETPGFVPPKSINPLMQVSTGNELIINEVAGGSGQPYAFTDWRGMLLVEGPNAVPQSQGDKFNKTSLPHTNLATKPYSTRDTYSIYGDFATDYFRHGLQVLNNINVDFAKTNDSTARLSYFRQTPAELEDPVMFGFEIVIDAISSPLLNGSIKDFIDKFGPQVSEIASRALVYEEFKNQFVKIFKTKGTVAIDNNLVVMTGAPANSATTEANEGILSPGKKAYMSHYMKKISGIDKLSESNSSASQKYLADYRKDIIGLEFTEDVSLTIGTLAHLYKLLYWSKPNGKGVIPENLLRFNCDIIVSEVRNFKRVKKALNSNDILVIKDNVSRYVYSLRECQFYFKSMPHPGDITLGSQGSEGPSVYQTYAGLEFDFKYSTVKFEKWVAGQTYVGYNGGSIWKIGNPGARGNSSGSATTGTTTDAGQIRKDTSIPKFATIATNTFNQNGVASPFLLDGYSFAGEQEDFPANATTQDKVDALEKKDKEGQTSGIDNLKQTSALNSKQAAKEQEAQEAIEENKTANKPISGVKEKLSNKEKIQAELSSYNKKLENKVQAALERSKKTLEQSIKREIQTQINIRVALLNKTINKILESQGFSRMSPPKNVYTDAELTPGQRIFYDLRGDLLNFLGGPFGSQFAGGSQTIVVP